MSKKLTIGIVFGGKSGEHEVSILSAQSVISILDKTKYQIAQIYINKKGQWQLGFDQKLIKGKRAKRVYLPADPTSKELILAKQTEHVTEKVDIIFPVLHGTYGEDGAMQGLLELSGIPYVGAGITSSAIGMDKVLMKKLFKEAGLPVTKYQVLLRKDIKGNIAKVVSEAEKEFVYPIFTKPTGLGSSVGITKAHNQKELVAGLNIASKYDRKVLVEEAIDEAREIEVSVLGNDDPRSSVCGEVIPSKEFYDYEDKYILGKAKLIIPAQLPEKLSEKIRKMATVAFKAIDCAGMARVDFLVEAKAGKVFLSEINTIPGFTKISMYPKLWEASGLSYKKLIDELIDLALERYKDKSKNKTYFPSKLLIT